MAKETAKTVYLVLKNVQMTGDGPWQLLDEEHEAGNSDQAAAAAALAHGAGSYVAVPKRSFRPVSYEMPEPKPVKAKTVA